MEVVQSTIIKLSDIEVNRGQIPGLPGNPRFLIDEKFEKLKQSIQENPDIEGEEEEDDRFTKIRFKLTEEQAGEVKTAISLMRKLKRKEVGKIMDNSNRNGNALYLICKEWNNE